MNDAYSELELIVESLDAGGQRITVGFRSADEAQAVPRQSPPGKINIDFESLQADYLDRKMERYGNRLRDAVLAPDRARTLFGQAMGARPLRVRLHVRADDARLQGLHWETMTDLTGAPLSTLHGLAFSRYLPSDEPVQLRPASSALRALVAVANLSQEDRQTYGLAPIEFEQERLDKSMGHIDYDQLAGAPVTMNRLIARLQAGEVPPQEGYDILYLVAHGSIIRGEPQLLLALETEREKRDRSYFRSGQMLAERMARQLGAMPRLVVLASCSGAGHGMEDALYATGPRLAMEGVPAVIAMKGFVEIDMVESLLSKFFTQFQKTPEVDRAMQVARAHVQYDVGADDWWAPVLFMRLLDGRLASGEGGWQSGQTQKPDSDQPAVAVAPSPEKETQFPKPDPLVMANFNRMGLFRAMNKALDLEELKTLALFMEVPYDDLGGSGKSGKVREYIQWCERRSNKVEALLDALADFRPDQDWYGAAGVR